MAVRIDRETFTLQFQKKITLELAILNQKLSIQLRDEITQAFEQSLYTDLEINLNCGSIKTHSCILQSRVPKFYSKVCANRHNVILPDKTDQRAIAAFFRTLYCCNDVNKEETDVLKKLGNLKRHQQQQAATPESDVYLTPQASPSDVLGSGSGGGDLLDFVVVDEEEESREQKQRTRTHTHNQNAAALYYSLVPIDEACVDSDCSSGPAAVVATPRSSSNGRAALNTASQLLEKELAEQDELFESFKSILSKERNTSSSKTRSTTKRVAKPTSLPLPLTSSLNPKLSTNINDSLSRIYSKRKSYESKSNNREAFDSCSNQPLKNFKTIGSEDRLIFEVGQVGGEVIKKSCDNNSGEDLTKLCDFGQSTNIDSSSDRSEVNKVVEASKKSCENNSSSEHSTKLFDCGQSTNFDSSLHPTNTNNRNVYSSSAVFDGGSLIESNNMNKVVNKIESSGCGGVARGELEDVMSNAETELIGQDSSGYVTGSSPREHTVSSETFGVDATEAASSEASMPHDNDRSAASLSSAASDDGGTWGDTHDDAASASCSVNKHSVNLPDLVQIESSVNSVDLFQPAHSKPLSNHENPVNLEKSSTEVVINKEVSSGTNSSPASIQDSSRYSYSNSNGSRSSTISPEKSDNASSSDNNHCTASKNNFFIDASSLLDESELAAVQVTNITYNQKDSTTNCDVINCNENQSCFISGLVKEKTDFQDNSAENGVIIDQSSSNQTTSCDSESDDKKQSGTSDLTFEERRASLIRRNTFELDPENGKLSKLQQEFEKRKDGCKDNAFENCVESNQEQKLKTNASLDSAVKKPQSPTSLFIVSKNLHSQIQDDEMHSPDSLNNDAPIETMFEDRNEVEKGRGLAGKVNGDKSVKVSEAQDEEYESTKLFNSGLFYNVENTLDQCFKYDSNKLSDDKEENDGEGGSSRLSECSSSTLSSVDRLNRIESMPIVSGGASISDFSPPVSCASPLARRRGTEMAPILSGGSVFIPDSADEPPERKPKSNSSSFTASWIVDMSDAVKSPDMKKKKRTDSGRSSGSSEHTDDLIKQPIKSTNPALGFFIPLDDPKSKQSTLTTSQTKSTESQDSKTGSQNNINSSCGFFIDLNKSSDKVEPFKDSQGEKNAIPPDKKLFSMFIDISETSSTKSTENVSPKSKTSSPNLFASKKVKPKTHASRFHSKHEDVRSSDSQLSSESSIELAEHPEVARGKHLFSDTPPPSRQISTNENSTADLHTSSSQHESRKKGFFMFIEADNFSPVARRKTLPSGMRPNSQRHSWNLDIKNNTNHEQESESRKQHKRAHSVSVDRTLSFNVACDENKSSSVTSLVKNNTSSSKEFSSGVFDSGPASIDEATMRNSRAMISSWHGPVKPSSELQKVIARSAKENMRESRTVLGLSRENETHQKQLPGDNSETSLSCQSDETYDVRSESMHSDLSSCSRKGNNSTFIVNDISNVANANTSNDMELSTPSHDCGVISELSKDESDTEEAKNSSNDTSRLSNQQPLQTVKEESKGGGFVKLSDMDKEPPVKQLAADEVTHRKSSATHRMSRSIPEASWLESRIMTRSATSRSLSRLFPHLNVRSPDKDDPVTAEANSELSSMQSSIEPSALEGSTEDSCASVSAGGGDGACSRLGEDLLRMFVEEMSTDVVVEVGGRRVKAHKCILASRCQYFAAMLSGGWVESAGNVISLQGFSYNAVHFALCHIYSGTSNIPDSINIVELATLADMLCLEGLKEVIMYTLKVKYCHFFHKPCPLCTVGVLECLPLAAAYGLDEIYRKSLRWITKYFVRVWPTKGFATLPRELVDKCFKQHVVHMSVENVLDTVMCCEKLEATIPQVRWADPVFAVTQRLHETAVKFIAQHFSGVLSSEMFLSLGKDGSWNLDRLKKTLLSASDKLSPDQACRSLSRLHTILTVAESTSPPPEMLWSQEFVVLVGELLASVESSVVRQATRAVRTVAWTQMDAPLRHRIQAAACLVIVPGDERRRARHANSLQRRSEDRSSSSGLRSSDLHQVKVVMNQQNVGRRSNANAPHESTSASTTAPSKTLNRTSMPNAAKSSRSEENQIKTKSWPHRLAEVKSRYLEQRTTPVVKVIANQKEREGKCWSVPAQRKNVAKAIISSSDSSRTSSPAMRRSLGSGTRGGVRSSSTLFHQRKESETLSMSTDSLVESQSAGVARNEKQHKAANKIENKIKTKSAESLPKVNGQTEAKQFKAHSVSGSQNLVNKHTNKTKGSPVPLAPRKPPTSANQSSPRVDSNNRPSVNGRAKPAAASSPSPAMRLRNNTNQPAKQSQPEPNKLVKRTATYRVQNRTPLSPTKPKPTTTNRVNIANNNNNNSNARLPQRSAAAVNNNASNTCSPLLNRVVKAQPQLTVGSRSGTFLKDEPTVLRKPQPAAD